MFYNKSGAMDEKLSLCFQMKERQIFVAVRPDGVGGVVLHPVQHLPGLHQLDQRAKRRQVDQGLPLGRDHPRIGSTVLHQKLDTVLAQLESSALRKSNSRYTFELDVGSNTCSGVRRRLRLQISGSAPPSIRDFTLDVLFSTVKMDIVPQRQRSTTEISTRSKG